MTSKLIRSSARQKIDTVLSHRRDRRRRIARRAADAGVVEQDDLTLARQPIRQEGVPVVQGRGQVVEQQQREVSRPAEAPICEPDASDLARSIPMARLARDEERHWLQDLIFQL